MHRRYAITLGLALGCPAVVAHGQVADEAQLNAALAADTSPITLTADITLTGPITVDTTTLITSGGPFAILSDDPTERALVTGANTAFALDDQVSFTGPVFFQDGGSLFFGSATGFGADGSVDGNSLADLVYDSDSNRTIDAALAAKFQNFVDFEKRGTSTLTMDVNPGYSGATVVRGGTLVLGAADVINADQRLTVLTGAALDLNDQNQTAGSLTGAGTIDLGSATLTVGDAANTTFSGIISGTGALTKQGTGQLTLSGVNTYTGTTNVQDGTLLVSGQIAGAAAVANGGTLLVSGQVLGTTTVASGGTLNISEADISNADDAIEGNVTIDAGGTLTAPSFGDMAFGQALNLNGSMDLDDGSLNNVLVRGDLNTTATSEVRIDVDSSGAHDGIEVEGQANLGGGSVVVKPFGDSGVGYAPTTQYTILTATGGVVGTFDSVQSTLAFFDPALSYTSNNVLLTLERNNIMFADVAATGNQRAVGEVLNTLVGTATGTLGFYTNVIDGSTAQGARDLMEQLSGDAVTTGLVTATTPMHMGMATVTQRMAETRLNDAVGNQRFGRAGGVFHGGMLASAGIEPALLAAAIGQLPPIPAGRSFRYDNELWIQGFGGAGDIDGDNGPGADYNVIGFNGGYDRAITDNLRVGVSAGYGNTESSATGRDAKVDIDSFLLGLYADYTIGAWYIDGSIGVALNQFDSTRTITGGGVTQTAFGGYDGYSFTAYGETGYLFRTNFVGTRQYFYIQPLGSIAYTYTQQEEFQERGAGTASLVFESSDYESLVLAAGARAFTLVEPFGIDTWLELRGLVGYDVIDDEPTLDARFLGGGAGFTVEAADTDPLRGLVGGGVRVAADRADIYVNLDYTFSEGQDGYLATGGIRWWF